MPGLIGVELARVGTWDLSVGGRRTFTIEDFTDAIAASDEFGDPGIRPGHVDPRFDGEPSLGRVANMRVVGDRLVGDLVDLPAWLADRAHAAYPNRSIEGLTDVETQSGRKYRLVITGLALLGVTPPAMAGLADLPAAVAAAAVRIAASSDAMGLDSTPGSESGAASSAAGSNTHANLVADKDQSRSGGQTVDPNKLREALGLPETATDDEVIAAAAEAAARPAVTAETPPAAPPATAETPPAAVPVAAATPPPGMVIISQAVLDELQEGAKQGVAASQTLAKQGEDAFIARHRRRIGASSNPHAHLAESELRRRWSADATAAETFAATLPVVVHATAPGHESPGDDSLDADWERAEAAWFPEVAEVRASRRTNGGR